MISVFFFFNDTATTEIYTFPYTRSSDLARPAQVLLELVIGRLVGAEVWIGGGGRRVRVDRHHTPQSVALRHVREADRGAALEAPDFDDRSSGGRAGGGEHQKPGLPLGEGRASCRERV